MMKRYLAFLLALLLLPAAAIGASVREGDALETEIASGLRDMMNIVCTAAKLKDVRTLAGDEAPSQGLTEAVFAVYTYAESGALQAELPLEDLKEMYSAFFASGEYTLPEKGDCPCVTIENGVMKLDLEEMNETPMAGVWIYESHLSDEGRLTVRGDVYTAWGYLFTSAWDIPEEDLTWTCPVEACLEKADDALFGWRLLSYTMGENYLDGDVSQWPVFEDEAAGYSLLIPSVLGLSGEAEGIREWQTGDGLVTLSVTVLPAMTQAEADAHLEGEPGMIKDDRLGSGMIYYTVSGPERAQFLFAGEELNSAYMVRLTYPEERRDEMTLYLEFIRNSFSEMGSVNG